MSRTLPSNLQAAEDKPHHVFDWTVPARFDGKQLTIAGTLDYQPPPNKIPKPLIAVLVLVLVGGVAAIWLRRRRKRGTSHERSPFKTP
jgi:hypothetical protein